MPKWRNLCRRLIARQTPDSKTTHLSVGINGLDELLHTGLVRPPSGQGLLVLIKGRPGTGKTTLALQICGAAAKWENFDQRACGKGIGERPSKQDWQKPAFFSCEQSENDITERFQELTFQPSDIKIIGSHGTKSSQGQPLPYSSESSLLDCIHDKLEELLGEESPDSDNEGAAVNMHKAIVFDGLNLLDHQERSVVEMHHVVKILRNRSALGIIIYDEGVDEYSATDFMADMVLEMRSEHASGETGYQLNKIRIAKSRFQSTGLGWHQYKNKLDGIVIFPSVHFRSSRLAGQIAGQPEKPVKVVSLAQEMASEAQRGGISAGRDDRGLAELESRGDSSRDIIERMIGRRNLLATRGSSTVILGARRTMKTIVSLDFLRTAGAKNAGEGAASLLVSLLDNQGTAIQQCSSLCKSVGLWMDTKDCPNECEKPDPCRECFDRMYLKHFRPGMIAPDEFFDSLEQMFRSISRDGKAEVRRLAFWDLTQVPHRFPLLAREEVFLPLLFDYLKHSRHIGQHDHGTGDLHSREITSLFMGSPNTKLGLMAAAMADNVIFSWHDRRAVDGDPSKHQQGVAFFVDRIGGRPGRGGLYFIPFDGEEARAFEQRHAVSGSGQLESSRLDSYVRKIENNERGQLMEANKMISGIEALQGVQPTADKGLNGAVDDPDED